MKSLTENKLGGLLLMLGIIIIVVTIVFEFKIGWVGPERSPDEVPGFIYENWSGLKIIWGWQMVGHVFMALAFMHFALKANIILRLLWLFLVLCEVLGVVAFGFVLGSYYPALEIFDEQPALFLTVRGGIRTLYLASYLSGLLFIIPFCVETFRKKGRISKVIGIVTLSVMVGIGIFGNVMGYSGQISGLGFFLLPLVFGYSFWRNGNEIEQEGRLK